MQEQAAMEHSDSGMDVPDISESDIKQGNVPSMGGFGSTSTKDVPPSVAKHETVIKSQSH